MQPTQPIGITSHTNLHVYLLESGQYAVHDVAGWRAYDPYQDGQLSAVPVTPYVPQPSAPQSSAQGYHQQGYTQGSYPPPFQSHQQWPTSYAYASYSSVPQSTTHAATAGSSEQQRTAFTIEWQGRTITIPAHHSTAFSLESTARQAARCAYAVNILTQIREIPGVDTGTIDAIMTHLAYEDDDGAKEELFALGGIKREIHSEILNQLT